MTKFRVFDKIDNRLAPVVEINFADKWVGISMADGMGLEKRKFEDVDLMPWTGSKDRSGTDIYVGDIIELGKDKYGDVYFERGSFCVRDFYVSSFDIPSDAFGEGLPVLNVVSNIYEGPEFLEKK